MKCPALACTNDHRIHKSLMWHRFPLKRPNLLSRWTAHLKGNINFEHRRLCAEHFHPSCYLVTKDPKKPLKLKKNAFPTFFGGKCVNNNFLLEDELVIADNESVKSGAPARTSYKTEPDAVEKIPITTPTRVMDHSPTTDALFNYNTLGESFNTFRAITDNVLSMAPTAFANQQPQQQLTGSKKRKAAPTKIPSPQIPTDCDEAKKDSLEPVQANSPADSGTETASGGTDHATSKSMSPEDSAHTMTSEEISNLVAASPGINKLSYMPVKVESDSNDVKRKKVKKNGLAKTPITPVTSMSAPLSVTPPTSFGAMPNFNISSAILAAAGAAASPFSMYGGEEILSQINAIIEKNSRLENELSRKAKALEEMQRILSTKDDEIRNLQQQCTSDDPVSCNSGFALIPLGPSNVSLTELSKLVKKSCLTSGQSFNETRFLNNDGQIFRGFQVSE